MFPLSIPTVSFVKTSLFPLSFLTIFFSILDFSVPDFCGCLVIFYFYFLSYICYMFSMLLPRGRASFFKAGRVAIIFFFFFSFLLYYPTPLFHIPYTYPAIALFLLSHYFILYTYLFHFYLYRLRYLHPYPHKLSFPFHCYFHSAVICYCHMMPYCFLVSLFRCFVVCLL